MKTLFILAACSVVMNTAPFASAQDMIDLSHATIWDSPLDISTWPVTTSITRVAEDPKAGISLDFAAKNSWPDYAVPGWNGGTVQYTVWLCVQNPGWSCAGFIQMWKGRSDTDGSIPAILSGYQNYAYASRWGAMFGYVPKAGDTVGILVSAGNARDTAMVTSVRERSNVVTFQLPAGDTGTWGFDANTPSPLPVPVPVSPPVDTSLDARVSALEAAIVQLTHALDAKANSDDLTALMGRVATLEAKPIPASCSASVFGVPIHCALQ